MPFMHMENIGNYIKACTNIGLPAEYNFMTVDLFEGKNLAQVALNIVSLKRQLGFGFDKNEEKGSNVVDVLADAPTEAPPKQEQVALPEKPTPVASDGELTRTGQAMMAGHIELKQTEPCVECLRPITGACVTAFNRYYHPNCFVCKKCGHVKLARAKYYEHGKNPYCFKCILIVKPQTGIKTKTANKGFDFKK